MDTFSVGRELHGALFGGDIRLGSLGLGKGPEQTREAGELDVDTDRLASADTRVQGGFLLLSR